MLKSPDASDAADASDASRARVARRLRREARELFGFPRLLPLDLYQRLSATGALYLSNAMWHRLV